MKLLLIAGAATLLSTGAAAYFRMEARVHKERAAVLEETNKTLRADISGRNAAAAAFNRLANELRADKLRADAKLEKDRENDETLDACFKYDPGVDITGGLWTDLTVGPSSPAG